jgi:regulator of sirC expression with transglutaminase-like and TPR domain
VYLDRRLGNCVSMPVLFAILADRIGLDVALATAPDHIFVRWRDRDGHVLNLETTSGAHPAREAWFRENMPMSDRALANGLYMRSLGRREGVALLANSLLSHLIDVQSYSEAIEVADVILTHAPRDVWAILKKGTACGHLIRTEFEDHYPHPFQIPMPQRLRYLTLARRNRELFEVAEALGWEPEDEASEEITGRIESCS